MKIIGIAALALILAAPLATANADPARDQDSNGRNWQEHSRQGDRDRDAHQTRRGDRDRDARQSRHWDRDRHWGRDYDGYGSSYRRYRHGGPFPWYGGR